MTRLLTVLLILTALLAAQEQKKAPTGYTDTPPIFPGSKWKVHDDTRPRPKVITPAEQVGQPPSDAVVLFDGTNLDKWHAADGGPAKWKAENGYIEVVPRTGDMISKQEFGDCQLHVEWRMPYPPKGNSQERGNSGVFLLNTYEIQVLDSYDNVTYADGQAGSVYGQSPPMVNASRKPGEWQSYDIIFTAPHFKDGELETPAYVTVLHNGVVVQNHWKILGTTFHRQAPQYATKIERGPIKLQDHQNPTRFRNIWVREIKAPE